MADSFMIHFNCNGKPCFANVYAYDTTPREYHVHIVNTYMHVGLPENFVLIERNGKVILLEGSIIESSIVKQIEEAIREQQGKA